MNDSDVAERWITQAFAQVEVPSGVEAWRVLVPRLATHRKGPRRVMAIGLTAGIAAVLFIASIAGTVALTHSHPAPPVTVHPTSAPAATQTAAPSAQAASACSRLKTPEFLYEYEFNPPGATEPAISCAHAIATFLCPPHYGSGPCPVLHGLPVTAELARFSLTSAMGEVRGPGLPFVGPPFVPNNLLVWQLTWVPTVCTVDSTGVSGSDEPPFTIVIMQIPIRCRSEFLYLIDATTGDFVSFDNASRKSG